MERTILHCDLNNYFASVECLTHPEWRDVPMAVCGSQEERHGIVLAKNYPARAYGIKTGETVVSAKAKCPGLVIAPTHYREYLRYSRIVRDIYACYTDEIEPMGLDECWLDVTGSLRLFGGAEKLAHTIRERVKHDTGLTISVGVSFNKVFAKLASDMKKPDAVTVISRENFREVTRPLAADEMIGVGRSTMETLFRHGCRTIGDIADCGRENLRRWLGKNGERLWICAAGLDTSPVIPMEDMPQAKSVSCGITTPVNLYNYEQVKDVVIELAQEVGRRLRNEELSAKGIAIAVRDTTLAWHEYRHRLTRRTQSTREVIEAAMAVFRERYGWETPVRALSVRAIDLVGEGETEQIGLFDNTENRERLLRLERAVDGIRLRHGVHSVASGTYFRSRTACDKIAEPHQSFRPDVGSATRYEFATF